MEYTDAEAFSIVLDLAKIGVEKTSTTPAEYRHWQTCINIVTDIAARDHGGKSRE